jgi:hypothetical protein
VTILVSFNHRGSKQQKERRNETDTDTVVELGLTQNESGNNCHQEHGQDSHERVLERQSTQLRNRSVVIEAAECATICCSCRHYGSSSSSSDSMALISPSYPVKTDSETGSEKGLPYQSWAVEHIYDAVARCYDE